MPRLGAGILSVSHGVVDKARRQPCGVLSEEPVGIVRGQPVRVGPLNPRRIPTNQLAQSQQVLMALSGIRQAALQEMMGVQSTFPADANSLFCLNPEPLKVGAKGAVTGPKPGCSFSPVEPLYPHPFSHVQDERIEGSSLRAHSPLFIPIAQDLFPDCTLMRVCDSLFTM